MAYDAGLVARIEDCLPNAGIRGARQKNVFGGRGFLRGKSTFVIAWGDGLIVKCHPLDYPRALTEPGVIPFAPDGEKPMGMWVVVPADAIADEPQLTEWLRRAYYAVSR